MGSSEPVEMTTHETVSLATGAVAFSLPIVSLPQRQTVLFASRRRDFSLQAGELSDQLLTPLKPTCIGASMSSMRLLSFSVLFVAAIGAAQTPTAINIPTAPASQGVVAAEAGHEQLSLATGGLSFFIPVVSLPQRNGVPLDIGFVYTDSRYDIKETGASFENPDTRVQGGLAPLTTTVEMTQSVPGGFSQAVHVNLPTLSADLTFLGVDFYNASLPGSYPYWYNDPDYCTQNWRFTDWDGSTHTFFGFRDCSEPPNDVTWKNIYPLLREKTAVSLDNDFYTLDASNASDLKVIKRDGTVYHFTGYNAPPDECSMGLCEQGTSPHDDTRLEYYAATFNTIVDTHGNTITSAISPSGLGSTITDTLGRVVTFGTVAGGASGLSSI